MDLLDKALADKPPRDQAAVVEVAEQAAVAKPPGPGAAFPRRSLALEGTQSRLADGVQLAMAVAPPATARGMDREPPPRRPDRTRVR